MRMPTGSRWVSDNYITRCYRRLELVSSVPVAVGVSWGQDAELRASGRQRAWALSDPWLSSPARMQKKCCYGQKNLGSICSSLSPSPTHLSHTTNINPFATLSRIKCERYIFIKKCVRSFIEVIIIVDNVSAYICIMYMYTCSCIMCMYVSIQQYLGLNPDLLGHWQTL